MSGLSNKDNEDNEEIWKERCMNCIRCNEKVDCDHCWPCRMGRTCELRRCFSAKRMYNEKVKKQADENLKAIMAKTAAREAQAASTSSATYVQEPVEKKKRGRKKKSETAGVQQQKKNFSEMDYVPSRPTRQQSADLRRKRPTYNSEPYREPRQCLNPDCIYESRSNSKYCSDDCGKALARMRLTEILPIRCKTYFAPGPAGPRTVEDEIKQKRAIANKDVQDLTTAEKHMIRFLEKLHEFMDKQLKLLPLGTEEKDDDTNIQYERCLVCGQADISVRKYAKHIELCWSRSEKAISFGAPEKNNDTFYCEKYDARTNTYCKRLKSLCPEHRKAGIDYQLKVCGYPMRWERGIGENARTFSEVIEMEDPFGEEGCRTKRDACHKHYKWYPSLCGSIELEQACLFQKMFELCHETHRLNTHAEWTTNALSIMMHKTPKIIDRQSFMEFVKNLSPTKSTSSSQGHPPGSLTPSTSSYDSSSSSREKTTDQDEEMEDTAEFLASLAVQKAPEDNVEQEGDDEEEEDVEDEEA